MTTSTGAAGVPSSWKRPGTYLKVKFGASPNAAGGGPRRIAIFACKTSAGTGTVDTRYQIFSPDDAKTLGGEGSEAHLMATAVFAVYPAATVDLMIVSEPAGVKASATLTITGAATGTGTLVVYIHGVPVPVSIVSGDSANTQATNIALAINGFSRFLNGTAAASTNTVVFTARHNGTRGNSIRVRLAADTTITGASYAWGSATLGSGTGDDSMTNILAVASANREHYYALAQMQTTQLQAVQSKIGSMAGPLEGMRQVAVSVNVAAFGSATTQAQTLNEERMQILWIRNCESLPCVAVAAWTAERASAESDDISANLSSMNPDAVNLWPYVQPQASDTDKLLNSEAAAALNVGLTPVQVDPVSGHPYVVMSISTHSLDSGNNPDTRTLTTNKVQVPDAIADAVATYVPTAFPAMKLAPDPKDGDDPLPPKMVTPGVLKMSIYAMVNRQYQQQGHIVNLDDDFEKWAFNVDAANKNRCDADIPNTPSEWFTQFSANILQLSA